MKGDQTSYLQEWCESLESTNIFLMEIIDNYLITNELDEIHKSCIEDNDAMREKISDLEGRNIEKLQEYNVLLAKFNRLENENRDLKKSYLDVKNSLSWRYTKLFRIMFKLIME